MNHSLYYCESQSLVLILVPKEYFVGPEDFFVYWPILGWAQRCVLMVFCLINHRHFFVVNHSHYHCESQSLETLGHYRPLLVTLVHFGSFRASRGHFVPLQATLGHSRTHWATLVYSGHFWAKFGHFGPLWHSLGPLLGTLVHSGPLWATLSQIWLLWDTSVHFESTMVLSGHI